MNNMGIVVENLDRAISFFSEAGLTLEARAIRPLAKANGKG